MVDLHGVFIRSVEMGSFKDMTLDPTSISGSLAFSNTVAVSNSIRVKSGKSYSRLAQTAL